MMLSLIVAIDQQNAIGRDGDQLAYISDDLKRFKQLTSGHSIVMGRKTFNALPKGALPNRRNIVLTTQNTLELEGCEVVTSVEGVMQLCENETEVFIIGGGEIYKLFLPKAHRIYLTRIHHAFQNTDTWFPEFDVTQWEQISCDGPFVDTKSNLEYSFELFQRL